MVKLGTNMNILGQKVTHLKQLNFTVVYIDYIVKLTKK